MRTLCDISGPAINGTNRRSFESQATRSGGDSPGPYCDLETPRNPLVDEIAGYMEKPDFLAGRRGFKVRDEIRMVRPGLYLGRAYLDRIFILNFTLVSDEIAKRDGESFTKTGQAQEECWTGTQPRKVMAAK